MAREGFLKDKCGPRAKKFERHCPTPIALRKYELVPLEGVAAQGPSLRGWGGHVTQRQDRE